ncbi:MAG: cell division protein FtsQ/DivIB [Lachnospira sp.]
MTVKKKRKKKLWLIPVILVILLVAAAGVIYFEFNVTEITYVGNEHYSDEQMTEKIFGTSTPNAVIFSAVGNKNKTIPFIEKYDVEVDWPDRFYITVYEKAIVGYIKYMGCNMYFDKDGIVVESSTELYQGVPEILGLRFDSIVLNSKLEVGDDSIFQQILDLTQSFDKYELGVNKVYFDSSLNVILYMGDVKVCLGSSTDYTDKLFELKQIQPELTGLKGTLHMEDYTGNNSSIIFKKEN